METVLFFKTSYFVFNRRKKRRKVWNNMRVSKLYKKFILVRTIPFMQQELTGHDSETLNDTFIGIEFT